MKISINKIIDEVLETKDLKDIERVKSLYLKLGEIFAYNVEYFYTKETEKIYEKDLTIKSIQTSNYQNKINVVCKQIAQILVEAINKMAKKEKKNMTAKLIGYEEGKKNHVITLLTLENSNYYLDLYKDLYRIQKGMRTKYFAPEEEILAREINNYYPIKSEFDGVKCQNISKEENEKIDKKIGYLKYGIYTEDVIEMLKEEIEEEKENILEYISNNNLKNKENKLTKFKIDFIFKHFKNNYLPAKTMEIFELERFYLKTFANILNENDKENIDIFKIHIETKEKPDIYYKESILYEFEFTKENRFFYYIYNSIDKGYREITEEEILDMKAKKELTYKSKYNTPKFERKNMERN